MDKPFQLTFTLKQHTPLIHFQHDQDGATLRASELKPKLDKYIIQQMGGWANIPVEWRVGKHKAQHKALDYKVRICAQDIKVWDVGKQYPNFFGHLGEKDNTRFKRFSMAKQPIAITFNCGCSKLLELLKKSFPLCVTKENFGTRQSKGFGSFAEEHISKADFEKLLRTTYTAVYKKDVPKQERDTEEQGFFSLFKTIELEYKLLKAGDSRNKRESKLREFFNNYSPPIEWEKPAMQEIVKKHGGNVNIRSKSKNRKYVRAMLGLAENFEYPKNGIKISVEHVPDRNEENIERFRSLVTVKVFDRSIYFCASDADFSELMGKKFRFKFNKIKGGELAKPNEIHLLTPSKTDAFNLNKFLNSSLTNWTRIK